MSSLPSPDHQHRGKSSSKSRIFGRAGWFVAVAAVLLAAFLDSQNFALKGTLRLKQTEVELASVETQSVKQQLAAERILAARQIADLKRGKADNGLVVFVQLRPPGADAAGVTAVIAWQPSSQSGVFYSTQLSLPNPGEEYRLWIEGNDGLIIAAGAIAIAPSQTTKVEFKTDRRVDPALRFVLTREHRGEVTVPSRAILLSGTP